MIATRARSNSIKQRSVKTTIKVNKSKCLIIAGINEHTIFTLGKLTINIFDYPTINIIPNETPIEHDGILGTEFF